MCEKIEKVNDKDIFFLKSPNNSEINVENIHFIIVHYTASLASAKNIAKYFSRPSAKVSAHFVIGFEGEIYQCVPLNRAAWHAGKSQWLKYKGLNRYSIGIEVCNPGILEKINERTYATWTGKKLSTDEYDILYKKHPITEQKAGWIPFNEKQIESLIELGNFISDNFEIHDILGHDMISPFRKTDPGPCINPNIYNKMLGDRKRDDYPFEGTKVNVKKAFFEIPEIDSEEYSKNKQSYLVSKQMFKGRIVDRIGYWFKIKYENSYVYAKVSDVHV